MIVLDWELRGWRVAYVADNRIQTMNYPRDALRDGVVFDDFPDEREFGVESAHLQPNVWVSKAQVYEPEELDKLRTLVVGRDIKLLMLPGRKAHRARHDALWKDAEHQGKDGYDRTADAWLHELLCYPELARALTTFDRAWPVSSDELRIREAAAAIRRDMTLRLNRLRWTTPAYVGPEFDRMLAILEASQEHPDAVRYAAELAEQFGVTRPVRLSKLRKVQLMSLYVAVRDEEGAVRRDPRTGRPVGVDFVVRRLLMDHSYGAVSGVARSNLWWFLRKPREVKLMGRSELPSLAELDVAEVTPQERAALRVRVRREVLQPDRVNYRRALRALVRILRDG